MLKLKVDYRGYYSLNTTEARAILVPEGTILNIKLVRSKGHGYDYVCEYQDKDVIIEDCNATLIN